MRNYSVYFEIYGKKMKSRILAKDKEDAKSELFKKIIFHKVEIDKKDDFNDCLDLIEGFSQWIDEYSKTEKSKK